MMTYSAPGVYVEEVSGYSHGRTLSNDIYNKSISRNLVLGTKSTWTYTHPIPAFVGYTQYASQSAPRFISSSMPGQPIVIQTSLLGKPTLINSWEQFTKYFGEFIPGAYLPDAVYGYFQNGGSPCYIVSLRAIEESKVTIRAQHARVDIPSVGEGISFRIVARDAGLGGNQLSMVIEAGEENTFTVKVHDDVKTGLTLVAGGKNSLATTRFRAIEITDPGSIPPKPGTYGLSGGADKMVVDNLQPLTADELWGNFDERTGLSGLVEEDSVRLIAFPDVMAGYRGTQDDIKRIKALQEVIINHCENPQCKDRFAILDTPPNLNAPQVKEWRTSIGFDTSYAALYYPWIEVADYSNSENTTRFVPPSGHIAGIYARNDLMRGVHKFPANECIIGGLGLERNVKRGEQDILDPIGVNVLRHSPGRGILVWGARTLTTTEAKWRYVKTRRLMNYIKQAIRQGTEWVIFEPYNNPSLWSQIQYEISNFLHILWRSGALFGSRSEEAFNVRCDEELNPLEQRSLGIIIAEISLSLESYANYNLRVVYKS